MVARRLGTVGGWRVGVGLLVLWWLGIGHATAQLPAATAPLVMSGFNRQGQPVSLQALRGKVVLVFLWSTDCPVCLDKMPEIRRNLEGWKGRDFVVLALNQDGRESELKAYEAALQGSGVVGQPQLQWLWRRAPGHRDNLGAVNTHLPSTWVLNREGQLVRQHTGRWNPTLWDEVAELVLQ